MLFRCFGTGWRGRAVWAVACAAVAVSGYSMGMMIDFETVPGSTPSEGLAVSNQYVLDSSVIFRLENGESPVLAQAGGFPRAFFGPPNGSAADNPAPGQGTGEFFLTDDGLTIASADPPALIIGYGRPTMAASGVLLDVDQQETYTIQARDLSENVLATITIADGDPGTGDGVATPWSFDLAEEEIFSIRIQGEGPAPGRFDYALDNFNPHSAGVTGEGDYDGSGQIEQGDLDIVLQNWGTDNFPGDPTRLPGGGPFDGGVDQNELDGVLQNWGGTTVPTFMVTGVPEPAGLVPLLLSVAGLGHRRQTALTQR